MRKDQNYNHPKRGDRIKVEPIKKSEAIEQIKILLKDKPRDHALFVLGVNTNLGASDLLRITAGQVEHIKVGEDLEIVEKKTSKPKRITLNKSYVDDIQKLLALKAYLGDELLFIGQRGPLTVPFLRGQARLNG